MTGFSAKSNRQNALKQSLIGVSVPRLLATSKTGRVETQWTHGQAIDTGTTLIYVPPATADAFYAQIPGAKSAADMYGEGFYQFPCKASIALSISLNKAAYSIAIGDFNLGRTEQGSS